MTCTQSTSPTTTILIASSPLACATTNHRCRGGAGAARCAGTCPAPQFACSAFVAVDAEGRVRTGRNYDFKDDTSALLVRNHPRGGYASIGFAALNNRAITLRLTPSPDVPPHSWARLPSSTVLTNAACPLPYSLWIPSPVTGTRNAPSSIPRSPSVWSDRAATTQEAVDLLSAYDMHAMAGRDYHFFINDAAGDARVVEGIRAIPTAHARRRPCARSRTSTPAMVTKCCPTKKWRAGPW